jgi:hypothetical protein
VTLPKPPSPFDDKPYGKLPRRRRVLIALLAAGTAIAVVLMLLDPPGGVVRPPPGAAPPDTARCGPGQASGCVGSKTDVLPLSVPGAPAMPSAPASRSLPARPSGR